MHLPKTRDVPKLGRKVTAFLDLLFIEANVLATWRSPNQSEAQTICAILCHQGERIGRVPERFRHLPALLITHDPGKENIPKWNVIFIAFRLTRLEFQSGDDHSRNPEENNVG